MILSRGRNAVVISASVILLVVLLFVSVSIGAVHISWLEIIDILLSKIGLGSSAPTDVKSLVLVNIRLPRLLFTVLIGAALGVSGASLQGLFRNPLVEPGIIGISGGAALGAIAVILGGRILSPTLTEGLGQWMLPLFAFLGGIGATFLTLQLGSYQGRTQTVVLILSGVAITALAGAAIGLAIFYSDEQQLRSYNFWTLGDLSAGTWERVLMLLPMVLISVSGLMIISKHLNVLALGEAEAFHLGINVERLKIFIVLLSSFAVSSSVAFAGSIGFIGLVVPHIIRIVFTPDHELLVPLSATGGASLLMLSDIFARTVVAPAELPIGIVTAAIGTPFFIYLLSTIKKKGML